MTLELTREEAQVLHDFLQQKVLELDKEINRTDSFEYKDNLRRLDRTIERVVGQLTAALERASPND